MGKLRCWPGATCLIVSAPNEIARELVGRTIVVRRAVPHAWGHVCWEYDPPILVALGFRYTAIADSDLVPLTPNPRHVAWEKLQQALRDDKIRLPSSSDLLEALRG